MFHGFTFPKIHKDGLLFGISGLFLSFLIGTVVPALGWIMLLLTAWCFYFFRDPNRVIPQGDFIVSPADGVVQNITEIAYPEELGLAPTKVLRISIFLNIFNVHVNRIPCDGVVQKVHYHPGKFFNASLDKASQHNERNHIVLAMANKKTLVFTQIAGLIARRIVCTAKKADKVSAGDRYGIIRFGSRMDVYLPKGEKPIVAIGQQVIGGETVLCKLGAKESFHSAVK